MTRRAVARIALAMTLGALGAGVACAPDRAEPAPVVDEQQRADLAELLMPSTTRPPAPCHPVEVVLHACEEGSR